MGTPYPPFFFFCVIIFLCFFVGNIFIIVTVVGQLNYAAIEYTGQNPLMRVTRPEQDMSSILLLGNAVFLFLILFLSFFKKIIIVLLFFLFISSWLGFL